MPYLDLFMSPHFQKVGRRRLACLLAAFLFCIGSVGVLFSPSLGVVRGTKALGIPVQKVKEHPTATIIETSEFVLPTVSNGRGLFWMSGMMVASVLTMFSGVYLFSTSRRL